MEVGKSYLFSVRRRGNTQPVQYRGTLIKKSSGRHHFRSLEQSGIVIIHVDDELLPKDDSPVELVNAEVAES